jgi:hypothetical protein
MHHPLRGRVVDEPDIEAEAQLPELVDTEQ